MTLRQIFVYLEQLKTNFLKKILKIFAFIKKKITLIRELKLFICCIYRQYLPEIKVIFAYEATVYPSLIKH